MRSLRALAAVTVALAAALVVSAAGRPPDGLAKVDAWVLDGLAAAGESDFLVVLRDRADLSAAREIGDRTEKGRFVFERLRAVAEVSQRPLREELVARGVEHRPFWIVNAVWAKGDRELVEALATRHDVSRIAANPEVPLQLPAPGTGEGACPPGGIESGIQQLDAPDFWGEGFTGQGVVVAGADTGYDWDHPGLIGAYRGWNGSQADHNYNWHDAIHSGGGSCGPDSPEPCDDGSHGTHTMGTMVGDDGVHQVGMAPGARWIGCRNMNQNFGTPASYMECFEFFVAPTDLSGANPLPELAPHVINNSWSCPTFEGCDDPDILLEVVENTRAAGIVVVVSAGNSGSGCSTVNTPAAIYDASFTVGSVDVNDQIAGLSSRGPVTVDGSGRLKPDVSARGVSVCSTVPGGYATFSGTSMAGPHVAGLVALLISSQSCFAGDVDAIEDYIRATTIPRTTTQSCGGVPGDQVPNNTYGWGSARAVLPTRDDCGPTLFLDGFESGDTTAWDLSIGR